jgi:hypothetical protein
MTFDPVTRAAHYNDGPIEVIHLSRCLGAHLSQIVQYAARAHLKGDEVRDLRKALFWADDLIATMNDRRVMLSCMTEPDFSMSEFTRQMREGRGRIIRMAWQAAWARDIRVARRCLETMRDAIVAEIALMEDEV